MLHLNLRPQLEYRLTEPKQELFGRLSQVSRQSEWQERLKIFDRYGELHLPREVHRVWSPHLYFYLVEHNGQEYLHGHFAPRIQVWTLVWVCYLFLAFSAFFAGILSVVQWQLGLATWGLPIALIAMLLWFLLLAIANLGMHWSRDQMAYLTTQFESLIDDPSLT